MSAAEWGKGETPDTHTVLELVWSREAWGKGPSCLRLRLPLLSSAFSLAWRRSNCVG